ncbi:MAG: secretion protein HlyD [Robiginitomaculum sp.]|nr:MAG: secretion protein HlyD [Robiginitomaculum sp.]
MTRLSFLFALGSLLAACSPTENSGEQVHTLQGYGVGRTLYLAPRTNGPITTLMVAEGDTVSPGDLLFTLDDGTVKSKLDQAEAALMASHARLADLRAGGRLQDIKAARENVAQAEASLVLAEENHTRSASLVRKGQAPQARLDQDTAALAQAKAALRAQKARLDLIRAPARQDKIAAAEQEVQVQDALVQQARTALDDLSVQAPNAGLVQTLIRRVGEIAGPAQPVLALLPPENMRIRFFIPQTQLGQVRVGDPVRLSCDGCAGGAKGRIVFIAPSAEFTPPVIFTEKERTKLVYMAEVQPEEPTQFHPGQPVAVKLP